MTVKLSESEEHALYMLKSYLSNPSPKQFTPLDFKELSPFTKPELSEIAFAPWVDSTIIDTLTKQSIEPNTLAYKLLTSSLNEAKAAWKGLLKREQEVIRPYPLGELSIGQFIDHLNHTAFSADTLLHPSQQMLSSDRACKVKQLKSHLAKSLKLYEELSLEYSVLEYQDYQHFLKHFNALTKSNKGQAEDFKYDLNQVLNKKLKNTSINSSELSAEIMESYADSLSDDAYSVIWPLDINISDLIKDQISHLNSFDKIDTLPSPNSPNARRNHFIRNWIAFNCHNYSTPLWEITATIVRVYFNDDSITFSTVRDVVRNHKNGEFYKTLQMMMDRPKNRK